MTETLPPAAKGSPPVFPADDKIVRDEKIARDDKNDSAAVSLDAALHSINSSLERLQAINDRIHEQNESLVRISRALSGYREFKPETAQRRQFPSIRETPPAAASSLPAKPARPDARAPIPFVSPASSGASTTLSEAEILAIHLNNIKMRQEAAFFQNSGYINSPGR